MSIAARLFAALSLALAQPAAAQFDAADIDCRQLLPADWAQRIREPRLTMPIGHPDGINALAVSRDGRWLVSAGRRDGNVVVWDVKAKVALLRLENTQISRTNDMYVAFSPVRDELVASSLFGVMMAWDLKTLLPKWCKRNLLLPLTSLAYSEDGKSVLVAGGGGVGAMAVLLDAQTGKQQRHLSLQDQPGLLGTSGGNVVAALHRDAELLALGSSWAQDEQPGCIQLQRVGGGPPVSRDELCGVRRGLKRLEFSRNGSMLLGVDNDDQAFVWSVAERRLVHSLTGESRVADARFADAAGRTLVAARRCCVQPMLEAWALAPSGGRRRYGFLDDSSAFSTLAVAGDNMVYAGFNQSDIQGWKLEAEKAVQTSAMVSANRGAIRRLDVSTDGKVLLLEHGTPRATRGIEVRDISGRRLFEFSDLAPGRHGGAVFAYASALSPAGNLAVGDDEVRAIPGGEVKARITGFNPVFSADGARLYTYEANHEGRSRIVARDTAEWKIVQSVTMPAGYQVSQFAVAPKRGLLATAKVGDQEYAIRLFDLSTGAQVGRLPRRDGWVHAMQFSDDGRHLLVAGHEAEVWDVEAGTSTQIDRGRFFGAEFVTYVDGGKHILAAGNDGTARLMNAAATEVIQTLAGHLSGVSSVRSGFGGSILTSGLDGTVRAWTRDGKELFALVVFQGGDEAVVAPDGRFHAAPAVSAWLNWVQGLEILSGASRMRDAFLDRDIALKALGLVQEPAREIQAQCAITKKRPEARIQLTPGPARTMTVRVLEGAERWGEVVVSLQGREVLRANASPSRPITVDLAGRVLETDKVLQVDVHDAQGCAVVGSVQYVLDARPPRPGRPAFAIKSLGTTEVAARQGYAVTQEAKEAPTEADMRFFALAVGANYETTTDLRLVWAADDAVAMGHALEMAATDGLYKRGTQVRVLQSGANDPKLLPTRANIQRELEEIATNARAQDTVVLFLAGHGDAPEGVGGRYVYLTDDATGRQDLREPARLAQVSLGSDELQVWFRKLRAARRAVIVDTCRAGQLASVVSSVRESGGWLPVAIDQLVTGHGLFLIAGSAHDKVSYEVSPYKHGLLTYALLFGLHSGEGFEGEIVGVRPLFEYAKRKTAALARDLNREQVPEFTPRSGDASFPLGLLGGAQRSAIRLSSPRPLFVQTRLYLPSQEDLPLRLSERLNSRLALASYEARSLDARYRPAYQPVENIAGAYRVAGRYELLPDRVRIAAMLNRDGVTVKSFGSIEIERAGRSDDDVGTEATRQLMERTREALRELAANADPS